MEEKNLSCNYFHFEDDLGRVISFHIAAYMMLTGVLHTVLV